MTNFSRKNKNNKHNNWMTKALAIAQHALPDDVPIGCLIVRNNTIIGTGFNTREQDNDPTGHAEINALRQAAAHLNSWRLNDCTLYVTLEPCPMCASAILQARVPMIVFGASDPIMGALGSKYALQTDTPQISVTSGVLESECSHTLKAFFKTKRHPH